MKDNTRLVHGFSGADPVTGAISFPIYQTATFCHPAVGESTGFDYSRAQNPTRQELESTLAALEQGSLCRAFSSGMAAIAAVFHLLRPGQHVILSEDLYGGTYRLAKEAFEPYGISFEYIDTADVAALAGAIRPETAMIFLETPSNPMMRITDIGAVKQLIGDRKIYLVVDNTFLTALWQKPLLLGADIVVYSGTKYLCGHNDVIAGFLVVGNNQELADRLARFSMSEGAVLGVFDCWLMLRSLKTLSVRLLRQADNALKIAAFLQSHSQVTAVYYAGLPESPGYKISCSQATGFGAMISFRVQSAELAKEILRRVKLIYFAESLGGVESLITYPFLQTHSEIPKDHRDRLALDDTLLRLSVGIEDVEDIIEDLEQAFALDR